MRARIDRLDPAAQRTGRTDAAKHDSRATRPAARGSSCRRAGSRRSQMRTKSASSRDSTRELRAVVSRFHDRVQADLVSQLVTQPLREMVGRRNDRSVGADELRDGDRVLARTEPVGMGRVGESAEQTLHRDRPSAVGGSRSRAVSALAISTPAPRIRRTRRRAVEGLRPVVAHVQAQAVQALVREPERSWRARALQEPVGALSAVRRCRALPNRLRPAGRAETRSSAPRHTEPSARQSSEGRAPSSRRA